MGSSQSKNRRIINSANIEEGGRIILIILIIILLSFLVEVGVIVIIVLRVQGVLFHGKTIYQQPHHMLLQLQ